jgi:V-type H+-transporting ATPase subunit C
LINRGSLLTRNINDLIKKEDFIMDSEYLTTLIVIVPRQNLEDWLANYETLCEYVVPRSSKKLFEDSEQVMVNVTMFQKVVDTFKMKCRDRKFIVREFKYDEQAIAREQEQIKTLQQNMKDKFVWINVVWGVWLYPFSRADLSVCKGSTGAMAEDQLQ